MILLRLDGVTAFCFNKNKDHTKLTIAGFQSNRERFKVGENLLLSSSGDPVWCPYKITRTSFPMDVWDQFFIDLEFNPNTKREDYPAEMQQLLNNDETR